MALPIYATPLERIWHYAYRLICIAVFIFLVVPVFLVIPLSFNVEPYFSFTQKMLELDPTGYSLRWYDLLLTRGISATDDAVRDGLWWSMVWSQATWVNAARNSLWIGFWATILATVLGTIAALGLSRPEMPYRRLIMAILISPMIIPIIIIATGLFFAYSSICLPPDTTLGSLFSPFLSNRGCLANTQLGVILAHATLGIPFVIITVTATLVGFDQSLIRASASLGASPSKTFFKVIMPLILPGIISGALFAFVTSFDEVVTVLFIAGPAQETIPKEMWTGIREAISPAILSVATILVIISIALLTAVELLRRRGERLRGVNI